MLQRSLPLSVCLSRSHSVSLVAPLNLTLQQVPQMLHCVCLRINNNKCGKRPWPQRRSLSLARACHQWFWHWSRVTLLLFYPAFPSFNLLALCNCLRPDIRAPTDRAHFKFMLLICRGRNCQLQSCRYFLAALSGLPDLRISCTK